MPNRTWLTGGYVYDVEAGTYKPHDVLVQDGRIAALEPHGTAPEGDARIALGGAHLLPGLIDCHVHLTMPSEETDPAAWARRSDAAVALYAAKAAERTLLAGVTTVRDVGGWNYVEMAVRAAIEDDLYPGPRLFLAGRLLSITTATVEFYPGMYEVANGPAEVRAAARRQLAMGADLVKVMATGAMLSARQEDAHAIQYTREEIEAAAEIAHDNLKHLAAHAHAARGVANAVEAGADSIEHGTFADAAVLERMAVKGVFLVPTNCAFTLMQRDDRAMDSLPPFLRERLMANREIHRQAVALAHRLGVPIAMGTDAGTPGNHHGMNAEECVLMVEEVGMTPREAIRCATLNPARLLRQEEHLGSIAVGKHADIVGFRGAPAEDIREIRFPVFVMKAGTVWRNDIDGAAVR
ncbi:MAG: amidohydrolase family protein [Rhodospirillaceae bacterium]|nr:amidohydrolase family protein [Rhodospirillaceae bacterium]